MQITSPLSNAGQELPGKDELRLIPIGGLGEFGMNALVVHTARSLFLVDCGQLFPSEDQPGIDSIVPDFAYLEPFAERVDAVLLTHGHEDHLGALPYFLDRWPVPVYGTAFTMGLLEGKLREYGLGAHATCAWWRTSPACPSATARSRPSGFPSPTASPTPAPSPCTPPWGWWCTRATSSWTLPRWTAVSPARSACRTWATPGWRC